MNYDADIYLLSPKFLNDYPPTQYPEIMYKLGRPYNCLLIDTHQDYFICLPFRSYINHGNAYLFRNSHRSAYCKSGLDYSKALIIADTQYLDSATAIVDQDEYTESMRNMDTIVQETVDYVNAYIAHVKKTALLHEREFQRRYQFSTLKYFHDILGI